MSKKGKFRSEVKVDEGIIIHKRGIRPALALQLSTQGIKPEVSKKSNAFGTHTDLAAKVISAHFLSLCPFSLNVVWKPTTGLPSITFDIH